MSFPWGPEPPGYIPGLGRGAKAFETSIELGEVDILDTKQGNKVHDAVKQKQFDKLDKMASDFYSCIDERIKNRNKKRKKEEKKEQYVFHEIRDQFADLRPELKSITPNEWEKIPEIGATTFQRPKWELLTYAAGRTIIGDYSDSNLAKENEKAITQELSDLNDTIEMTAISRAKYNVMSNQFSKIVNRDHQIDLSGYMKELDNQTSLILTQITDLDSACKLYKSRTMTNPENPENWIIRARLEENAGRKENAINIIKTGLKHNPKSELIVLETARLLPKQDAIDILESCTKVLHRNSDKIWLQLASMQVTLHSKKVIVEEALHSCPKSSALWLVAAFLDDRKSHEILKKSIEHIPECKDVYINGIKCSSTFDDANYFYELSKCRFQNDIDLLIAWCMKCEELGKGDIIQNLIQEATKLNSNENWIEIAQNCETNGSFLTVEAIIECTPFTNMFYKYYNESKVSGYKTVSEFLCKRIAHETDDWEPFVKEHKDDDNFYVLVKEELKLHPSSATLVLQSTNHMEGDTALSMLFEFYKRNSYPIEISLRIIDIYLATDRVGEARDFALQSLKDKSSSRLAVRIAQINEAFLPDLAYLSSIVREYPLEPLLWLYLSQHSENCINDLNEGIKNNPKAGILHIELAKAYKKKGYPNPRIRVVFENARSLCSDQILIWLFSAEFENDERRVSILEIAKKKAKDPELAWVRQIELSPVEGRLNLTKEAQKSIGPKKEIRLLEALCYWRHGSIHEAKSLLLELTQQNPSWGDAWIFLLKFEKNFGSQNDLNTHFRATNNFQLSNGFLWEALQRDSSLITNSQSEILKEATEIIPDPMSSDNAMFGHYLTL